MTDPTREKASPEWLREMMERSHARTTQAVQKAQALAEQATVQVRARFPGWEVHAEACADSPAWAILKKSWAWLPELIVVGARGHSELAGLLLGGVCQCVLANAECSVRIGRLRQGTGDPALRLIVGTEGSAGAEAAVCAVAGRIWPAGSEVCVVGALDSMLQSLFPMAALSDDSEELYGDSPQAWLDTIVETAAERLSASGLTTTTLTVEGDPKKVILDQAERWQADTIFLGARGLRVMDRILLGSVSAAIAARASCSVEVVRVRQTEP